MKEVVELVKDINRMEYNVNVKLRYEFDELIDDQITEKQLIVLNLIHDEPQLTTSELAHRLNITKSAVSQTLNALEQRGMITRTINPSNRRELTIGLTQMALDYIQKVEQVELAIIAKYYSRLSLNDLNQLRDIYRKLESIVLES